MTPTRRRVVIRLLRRLLQELEAEEAEEAAEASPVRPARPKSKEFDARIQAIVTKRLRKLGLER